MIFPTILSTFQGALFAIGVLQALTVAPTATLESNRLLASPPGAGHSAVVGRPPANADPFKSPNPLWQISLDSLSATREQPIFSPSRRPPTPPSVAALGPPPVQLPPPKPEPEQPSLTLVGTVVADTTAIGIFVEQATSTVVRLRIGQVYDGWILRKVRGREATFANERRTATLQFPVPPDKPTK
jgi:hypothetical protein